MADIAKAIEPQSDRQNFVDYLSGPKVFTVTGTSDYRDDKGRAKVNIHLAEAPDRPFKTNATNLRLITIGWGSDDAAWPGRRIKLGGDPTVTFGRDVVGGIRVLALSDIDQPYTAKLPVTRGKKAEYRVEQLPDVPPAPPIPDDVTTLAQFQDYYRFRAQNGAGPDELAAIQSAAPTETPTNEEDN